MADPTVSDPACAVSSWAELPAWVVALRAATPQLSWKQAPALASGQGDWPAAWHLGEVALAAGSPPALLLCPVAAPTQLRVALTAAQPPPLWLPAGTSAESLAAALLPYREVAVPSRLQLPLPRRLFVGHTESLGAGFAELVARLAAHPAVEPAAWGSAYPDDPWPRPLPEALPAAARELLGRHYAAQAPDLPRSMTFVSRWSRSLLSLEDHAGALVLAIAPGRAAPEAEPSPASSPADPPLAGLPADVRWALRGLPTASAAELLACLQPSPPGQPLSPVAGAAAGDRVTALLGLAAIFAGDLQLIEVLRSLSSATSDWALRAAAIAVAQRQGFLLLLHELYASETDPELSAELHQLTETASGPRPAPRAGLLLLPQPGLAPARLERLLRGCGLQRVADCRQGYRQISWSSDDAHDRQATAAAEVDYLEDPVLGQRLIYLRGPQAPELARRCSALFPCWTAAAALELALQAPTPAAKVATLTPLAALLGDGALSQLAVRPVLAARLGDPLPAVRRAALLLLAQLADAAGAALRATLLTDPQLGAQTRSQLATPVRSVAELPQPLTAAEPETLLHEAEVARLGGNRAAASELLERALELAPLASAAYLTRARLHVEEGREWSALIDVTTALALARRQGLRLQAMHELLTAVRAQLTAAPTPPTPASELHAVANLKTLLRAGRPREVEEVAEQLLTLPGRAPLWWLAIGLARRDRGRPEQASAAFAAALALEPALPAARFLLAECLVELGDRQGAGRELAYLDPPVGQRRPRPSLLDAYADELLGRQAPWEDREHVFARVQLLRELGQAAAALAATTALLVREPEAADALLAHGILLGELGQPAAALAALDRALSALRPAERLLSEPDPLGTLQLYRALALAASGEKAAAAVALRQALRLSPERAAEVAAEPQLAALLAPGPLTAGPPGYAALRRLARQGLAAPADLAPDDSPAPAISAAVPAGQPAAAPPASAPHPGPSRPEAQPPPAALGKPARLQDAELLRTALRGQVAELLVAALAALDADASADACRALLAHAARGLGALQELGPQTFAAEAAAVQAILDATAAALGVGAATGQPA